MSWTTLSKLFENSTDELANSEMNRQIPYVNLKAQWIDERASLLPLIEKVLASGNYVGASICNIASIFLKSRLQKNNKSL